MMRELIVAMVLLSSAVAHADSKATKVTPLMTKDLEGIANKEGAMFLVEYPPGGSDPAHRHNASVFVYVIKGSIVMQAGGGRETTLKEGDTFFEAPGDIHTVGKNASDKESAKFIAFFVKEKGAPVVIPVK